MTPQLKHLFDLRVDIGMPIVISGSTPGRRFIPILGGVVEGAWSGVVLSGGGDWQTIEQDGTLDIDAHYVLDIHEHGAVEVRSLGLRWGDPSVLAALGRGEPVDPSAYYFRTSIRLRTAAPGLARLNHILAVATGARAAAAVHLKVFELG
jgi:Protein of unknown function (DUF3237)